MRAVLALVATLAVAGCVRPQVSICNVARACVVETCTTANACQAKPLELKGALP